MSDDRAVRFAVVDDHEPVRDVLAAASGAAGMVFVAGAASVAELATALGSRRVDVVVLDLSLGDGVPVPDNVAAVHRLGAPVLVHSIADRVVAVQQAFAAGAAGVVPKGGAVEVVLAAARAVASGGVLDNLQWATALDADIDFVHERLDEGERAALAALAAGVPPRAAAERLGVPLPLLRERLQRVRQKYAAPPSPT